jgi:CBS-domain-containing membrane protein
MITRQVAEQLTVGEVMLARPKTLGTDATVADLRRLFENRSVRTALLVDGEAFFGTVERDDVPDTAGAGETAKAFARRLARGPPRRRRRGRLDAPGPALLERRRGRVLQRRRLS